MSAKEPPQDGSKAARPSSVRTGKSRPSSASLKRPPSQGSLRSATKTKPPHRRSVSKETVELQRLAVPTPAPVEPPPDDPATPQWDNFSKASLGQFINELRANLIEEYNRRVMSEQLSLSLVAQVDQKIARIKDLELHTPSGGSLNSPSDPLLSLPDGYDPGPPSPDHSNGTPKRRSFSLSVPPSHLENAPPPPDRRSSDTVGLHLVRVPEDEGVDPGPVQGLQRALKDLADVKREFQSMAPFFRSFNVPFRRGLSEGTSLNQARGAALRKDDISDLLDHLAKQGKDPAGHPAALALSSSDPVTLLKAWTDEMTIASKLGNGLLMQCRHLQSKLSEVELESQTLDEHGQELNKQVALLKKQKEKSAEELKLVETQNWDLQLTAQELKKELDEAKKQAKRSNKEKDTLQRSFHSANEQVEQLKGTEERLTASLLNNRSRHEQEMAQSRKNLINLQRDKTDLQKKVNDLKAELAGKIQRAGGRSDGSAAVSPSTAALLAEPEPEPFDPVDPEVPSLSEYPETPVRRTGSGHPWPPGSVPSAGLQAMHVQTLTGSLGHAHRRIEKLRSTLHRERQDNMELHRMVEEYQLTIENLRREAALWAPAEPVDFPPPVEGIRRADLDWRDAEDDDNILSPRRQSHSHNQILAQAQARSQSQPRSSTRRSRLASSTRRSAVLARAARATSEDRDDVFGPTELTDSSRTTGGHPSSQLAMKSRNFIQFLRPTHSPSAATTSAADDGGNPNDNYLEAELKQLARVFPPVGRGRSLSDVPEADPDDQSSESGSITDPDESLQPLTYSSGKESTGGRRRGRSVRKKSLTKSRTQRGRRQSAPRRRLSPNEGSQPVAQSLSDILSTATKPVAGVLEFYPRPPDSDIEGSPLGHLPPPPVSRFDRDLALESPLMSRQSGPCSHCQRPLFNQAPSPTGAQTIRSPELIPSVSTVEVMVQTDPILPPPAVVLADQNHQVQLRDLHPVLDSHTDPVSPVLLASRGVDAPDEIRLQQADQCIQVDLTGPQELAEVGLEQSGRSIPVGTLGLPEGVAIQTDRTDQCSLDNLPDLENPVEIRKDTPSSPEHGDVRFEKSDQAGPLNPHRPAEPEKVPVKLVDQAVQVDIPVLAEQVAIPITQVDQSIQVDLYEPQVFAKAPIEQVSQGTQVSAYELTGWADAQTELTSPLVSPIIPAILHLPASRSPSPDSPLEVYPSPEATVEALVRSDDQPPPALNNTPRPLSPDSVASSTGSVSRAALVDSACQTEPEPVLDSKPDNPVAASSLGSHKAVSHDPAESLNPTEVSAPQSITLDSACQTDPAPATVSKATATAVHPSQPEPTAGPQHFWAHSIQTSTVAVETHEVGTEPRPSSPSHFALISDQGAPATSAEPIVVPEDDLVFGDGPPVQRKMSLADTVALDMPFHAPEESEEVADHSGSEPSKEQDTARPVVIPVPVSIRSPVPTIPLPALPPEATARAVEPRPQTPPGHSRSASQVDSPAGDPLAARCTSPANRSPTFGGNSAPVLMCAHCHATTLVPWTPVDGLFGSHPEIALRSRDQLPHLHDRNYAQAVSDVSRTLQHHVRRRSEGFLMTLYGKSPARDPLVSVSDDDSAARSEPTPPLHPQIIALRSVLPSTQILRNHASFSSTVTTSTSASHYTAEEGPAAPISTTESGPYPAVRHTRSVSTHLAEGNPTLSSVATQTDEVVVLPAPRSHGPYPPSITAVPLPPRPTTPPPASLLAKVRSMPFATSLGRSSRGPARPTAAELMPPPHPPPATHAKPPLPTTSSTLITGRTNLRAYGSVNNIAQLAAFGSSTPRPADQSVLEMDSAPPLSLDQIMSATAVTTSDGGTLSVPSPGARPVVRTQSDHALTHRTPDLVVPSTVPSPHVIGVSNRLVTAPANRGTMVSSGHVMFEDGPSTATTRPRSMPLNAASDMVLSTNPLIIHAITQTMVGEFMWKSTRSKGVGVAKERRHLRFFWIHPYTKTIHWSPKEPGADRSYMPTRTLVKSKSAFIKDIRLVADYQHTRDGDSASHSFVVTTNDRELKFKATSRVRHDIWSQSLSFLLTRPVLPSATNGRGASTPSAPRQRDQVLTHPNANTTNMSIAVPSAYDFGASHSGYDESPQPQSHTPHISDPVPAIHVDGPDGESSGSSSRGRGGGSGSGSGTQSLFKKGSYGFLLNKFSPYLPSPAGGSQDRSGSQRRAARGGPADSELDSPPWTGSSQARSRDGSRPASVNVTPSGTHRHSHKATNTGQAKNRRFILSPPAMAALVPRRHSSNALSNDALAAESADMGPLPAKPRIVVHPPSSSRQPESADILSPDTKATPARRKLIASLFSTGGRHSSSAHAEVDNAVPIGEFADGTMGPASRELNQDPSAPRTSIIIP
ncbi:hypothetical protein BJ085DRAFT_29054 [Dimargaris cristalligena]|uniref:PH domain-containing protein n=1 Tax=Dimargaris cristalligena TaxID=215637 RepID=A0A4P9ZX20_9FUNG|nr:hypothetical protein BJ085DRAFT_29054 [Dimargaris cristalligena]|eukprot:RKP38214.1 hypothetical protein BJ085DRAFT_29054 [Dimargaris cristalligena]